MVFGIVALAAAPLLGQDAGAAPGGIAQIMQFLPIVMIGLLLFFMIIRPQQREQRQRDEMLKQLKKNDRVWTTGGIFGVVTSVQTDVNEATIRIDEKNDTKLRVKLSAIASIQTDAGAGEEKSEKS